MIKVVDNLPVLKGRDIPTIAIVTSLYCEKLAVDAMMDHKVSYVKYKTEGTSSNFSGGGQLVSDVQGQSELLFLSFSMWLV